jgi:hypothetical protein
MEESDQGYPKPGYGKTDSFARLCIGIFIAVLD